MKPIRILVNGAFGHMGLLSVQALKAQADFSVVAQCGRQDDLASQLQHYTPDVVLDLTVADRALSHLKTIIDHGCRPIIGTSGLNQHSIAPLQDECQRRGIGGIVAPNFSIAAILMMRFAREAAAYFESAEIIEMHHPLKQDAPSGTAIKTAELLQQHGQFQCKDRVLPLARGEQQGAIAIHSIRMPGVLAKQQVLLGNPGEMLTLEANTLDRQAYMAGILLSCRRVMGLAKLVYGLENVMC